LKSQEKGALTLSGPYGCAAEDVVHHFHGVILGADGTDELGAEEIPDVPLIEHIEIALRDFARKDAGGAPFAHLFPIYVIDAGGEIDLDFIDCLGYLDTVAFVQLHIRNSPPFLWIFCAKKIVLKRASNRIVE
jgi:hypothetical protein